MLGILAGDTLSLNSSPTGTLGCVGCGATLQAGPGRSYKDGALGSTMQSGAGRAYQDGALGSAMARGPGRAYQDGALGFMNISSDFIIGGLLVGGLTWFLLSRKGG